MSNTKKKPPISWHFTCQLTCVYEHFKERYFRSIQSRSWLFENSDFHPYDENDMKEKVNYLVRLRKSMQEKLRTASYSELIQILTLVTDIWSVLLYCSEYFNVFAYLAWTSHEIKKVGGKSRFPKKCKNYYHWNASSGKKSLWRWQF